MEDYSDPQVACDDLDEAAHRSASLPCSMCNGAGIYDPGDPENGPRIHFCSCSAGHEAFRYKEAYDAKQKATQRAERLIELLHEHDEFSADGFAKLLNKEPTLKELKDYIDILEMTLGAYMEVPA